MALSLSAMRAGRAQKAQRNRAQTKTLPAPVGGWNARDGLPMMPEDDAVLLENWWAYTTYCGVRLGYTPYSATLTGYVETLMAYSGSTTNKFFAIGSDGTVTDVTTADQFLTDELGNFMLAEDGRSLVVNAVGSATTLTGLSNGRWQYTNFTTAAGNYLNMVNGVDYYRVYNGTAWFSDGDGAPYDITGVDSRTLIGINNFKNRLWFVQTGTLKAWYLPVNSIGGAAASLDMSSLCQRGGYLMAMGTWTIDAGYGVDDYAVWVTSNGEVLVWRMTDPTDANSIFLIGVWHLGSPVGRRCLYKYGGDLLLISQDGVLPLSGALQSSRLNPKVALTDKIQQASSYAVGQYNANFGWQLIYFPKANQLYLNVPVQERQNQEQYVMNTITKAWANFKDWDAGCWEIFQDNLYFGTFQGVNKAWSGASDGVNAITSNVVQAFNYLDTPGLLKRATMFKPTFYTNGTPSIFGGLNVDFDIVANSGSVNTMPSLYGLWDSATWDSGTFAPDLDVRLAWNDAVGVGNAFAPALNGSTNGVELQWVNSVIVFEQGAIL